MTHPDSLSNPTDMGYGPLAPETILPEVVHYAGEGEQWLFPIDMLRQAYPGSFSSQALPKLVDSIAAGGGVATIREPEIQTALPTLWAVIGSSGVGKTTVLNRLQELSPDIAVLKTASSRPQRSEEASPMYAQLPAPVAGETAAEYNDRVNIAQYGLLDTAWYYGNVYGLPKSALSAVPAGKVPVVSTAPTSIRQLRRNLEGSHNVVAVGLVPASYNDLIDVIETERGSARERSYRAGRAVLDTLDIPRVADYALLNPRDAEVPAKAEKTARMLMSLIVPRA